MKVKKICTLFAAFAIACVQATVPAFATETTQNGDWIDTTNMTPVYEKESVTTTSSANRINIEACPGDAIIEYEVSMNGQYQIVAYYDTVNYVGALIQQNWINPGNDGESNQDKGKHVQYYFYSTVKPGAKNGWLTGADSIVPAYESGAKIAFRIQIKGGVVSAWAADLDDEAGNLVDTPVYCYLGSYTYPAAELNTEPGMVSIRTASAQTVSNIKVYSLSEEAAVEIIDANKAVLTISAATADVLNASDVTLTDSFGRSVAATEIEKVSDTKYTLTFSENLEEGVIYSLELDALTNIGAKYLTNSDNWLAPSLDVDFSDESWTDYFGLYSSGNINGTQTTALCKNNQIELQETYALITKDTYAANSIIEFDGMITTENTADANGAKLQINTSADSYTTTDAKHSFNSVWIFDHDTGKKPQYFLNTNGSYTLANKSFSSEAIVKRGTMYSFRLKKIGTTMSLYMKEAGSPEDYSLVGTYSNDQMKTNTGRIEFCANNTSNYNGANFDNIRVIELNATAGAAAEENGIAIEYSSEPASVLTVEDFTVTASNGDVVTPTSVTRIGVKTYELTFDMLTVGETYTVTANEADIYGMPLANATAEVEDTKLSYELEVGTDSTKAIINNAETAPDAAVIFAVYDGTLLDSVTIKNMSEIDVATNSFTFGGVAEGKNCTLLIWDSMTGIKPLVE